MLVILFEGLNVLTHMHPRAWSTLVHVWAYEPISWTNVDLSSMRSRDIHLRIGFIQETSKLCITGPLWRESIGDHGFLLYGPETLFQCHDLNMCIVFRVCCRFYWIFQVRLLVLEGCHGSWRIRTPGMKDARSCRECNENIDYKNDLNNIWRQPLSEAACSISWKNRHMVLLCWVFVLFYDQTPGIHVINLPISFRIPSLVLE